ncbi:hypothetical protein Tco_1452027, partial [Tanacetum coccineum]
MALPSREQRHRFLRYEGLEYPDTDISDFEGRLARIHRREVHRVPGFDFRGLPDLMAEGLSGRMLMEHRDETGVSVFTSRAWRRMLDIRGPLVHELILEFYRISSARDFLGTTLSYTLIRDLILRLRHRLIAYSIAGRSQALEKVTVKDLFYLRGMDVGSVSVPYLLARYLRLFSAGRKSRAHISGGQFVARLAEHFGLLTVEILGGLTVIAPELPIIHMTELVRLQICAQFDDTWAWVAMGPERQPVATAGVPAVAEDVLIIDEGGQTDLAPEQAPQQPPPPSLAAARTIPQRHSTGLSEGAHPQHSRDGPDRGLAKPALPQHSRTCGTRTQDTSYPYLLSILLPERQPGMLFNLLSSLSSQTSIRRPREGNIDEYWWRIYESGNLEVLES